MPRAPAHTGLSSRGGRLSTAGLPSPLRPVGPTARGALPPGNLRGLQLHGPVPGVPGGLPAPAESGLGQELRQRRQGVRGRSVSRGHVAADQRPSRALHCGCRRLWGGPDPSRRAACPLPRGSSISRLPPLPRSNSVVAPSMAPKGHRWFPAAGDARGCATLCVDSLGNFQALKQC